ncbi:MAG: ATP-binding protein, partial [Proteobacteria bacterium]|nr:ATP-binding protein [Pseudomonadota bacterium]
MAIDISSINKYINLLFSLTLIIFLFPKQVFATEPNLGDLRFSKVGLNSEVTPNQLIRTIIKDKNGFIWYATNANIYRYDNYQLVNIKEIIGNYEDGKLKGITVLYSDSIGNLWIGTKAQGLFKYDGKKLYNFYTSKDSMTISSNRVYAMVEVDNTLWVATDSSLNAMNLHGSNTFKNYSYNNDSIHQVKNIVQSSDTELLLATKKALLKFDLKNHEFSTIEFSSDSKNPPYIWVIHSEKDQTQWLATDTHLFKKTKQNNLWEIYLPEIFDNNIVTTITSENNNLWFGTSQNGVYRFNKQDNSIQNFTHNRSNINSLSSNSITKLLFDNNMLWVTMFNGDVNTAYLPSLAFGLNKSLNITCLGSKVFNGFHSYKENLMWYLGQNKIAIHDSKTQQCETITMPNNQIPLAINIDAKKTAWIGTSQGISTVNKKKLIAKFPKLDKPVNFIIKNHNLFIAGTKSGLFMLNDANNNSTIIASSNSLLVAANFYDYSIYKDQYFFATNKGIVALRNGFIEIDTNLQKHLPSTNILSIHIDNNHHFWIGTYNDGLFKLSSYGEILYRYTSVDGIPKNLQVNNIIADVNNNIWISTTQGLKFINQQNNFVQSFMEKDGLQGNYFITGAVFLNKSGKIFFGGRNGFNAFYPEDVAIDTMPPKVVLTKFMRFGKEVLPNQKNSVFNLDTNINELNKLVLSHKDYVIGLEFSALDYVDASRIQYSFQLAGFDPDWNTVGSNNRTATYTNLPSGEYVFKVKAINKDGIWSDKVKELRIIVEPAPWFSWWAFLIYIILTYSLFVWYFRMKNVNNKMLTEKLRLEVIRQTKELTKQKSKVESLLKQKNELFVNISHEFRTPLTLILGPVNKLIHSNLSKSNRSELAMILRNANRLLSMIEQLLQLGNVSNKGNIEFSTIHTKPVIVSIYKSFIELARTKKIDLKLVSNDDIYVTTSKDAVDVILGNLLSNAIKYSPLGSKILINSAAKGESWILSVKDFGSGLTNQQQKDIFQRFTRLEKHIDIEGSGIGLSIVEEVVNINKGEVSVLSELGKGCDFIVKLPINKKIFSREKKIINESKIQSSQLIQSLSAKIIKPEKVCESNSLIKDAKEIVLIIEDNYEMRLHLLSVLQHDF